MITAGLMQNVSISPGSWPVLSNRYAIHLFEVWIHFLVCYRTRPAFTPIPGPMLDVDPQQLTDLGLERREGAGEICARHFHKCLVAAGLFPHPPLRYCLACFRSGRDDIKPEIESIEIGHDLLQLGLIAVDPDVALPRRVLQTGRLKHDVIQRRARQSDRQIGIFGR
jgi:hypothetical protein